MEDLVKQGLVKSIGVSNFQIKHLEDILENCTIVPQVNQIEFNPFQNPQELVKFCQKTGIAQWGISISTRTIKNIQVISKIQ